MPLKGKANCRGERNGWDPWPEASGCDQKNDSLKIHLVNQNIFCGCTYGKSCLAVFTTDIIACHHSNSMIVQ